jgi:hypothetical protein
MGPIGRTLSSALGALGALGMLAAPRPATWTAALHDGARSSIRYLAQHTGLPVLVVAAVLLVIGYRLLRRSVRFFLEVAAIAVLLLAATELGWIRW